MKLNFIIVLMIFSLSCEKKKENKDPSAAGITPEDFADAAAETEEKENKDLKVEEDSEAALGAHIDDLVKLKELAMGSGENPQFPEIYNHTNTLLTHYQFEVAPLIKSQSFRQAANKWDLGELYVTRLENAFNSAQSKDTLSDTWNAFKTSRELLVGLKKEWEAY